VISNASPLTGYSVKSNVRTDSWYLSSANSTLHERSSTSDSARFP